MYFKFIVTFQDVKNVVDTVALLSRITLLLVSLCQELIIGLTFVDHANFRVGFIFKLRHYS